MAVTKEPRGNNSVNGSGGIKYIDGIAFVGLGSGGFDWRRALFLPLAPSSPALLRPFPRSTVGVPGRREKCNLIVAWKKNWERRHEGPWLASW